MTLAATEANAVYSTLTFDDQVRDMIIERCLQFVPKSARAVTLGYQGDNWPGRLLTRAGQVDIVEGNEKFCRDAEQKFKNAPVTVHHAMFETFQPRQPYDTVIASGVLEHMSDPPGFMAFLHRLTAPGGTMILSTPNRRSLHRRIGVLMGFEPSTETLNQQAEATHAVKVYDRYELVTLSRDAGFELVSCQGMFLKPLPSKALAKFDPAYVQALMTIGDELSDYAKQLVLVARRPQ